MYPNCSFINLKKITPDWFSIDDNYKIFDVSLYHGHYLIILDKTDSRQLITQLDIDKNPIVVVNGHDIYILDDLENSGFGSVSIDKTRRILSSFTQYDTIEDQTFANDDVTDISDKYMLDTQDAILPIPLTTGLDALSPFTISITVNNGINETTTTFDQS